MTCTKIALPGGGVAIVCTRGQRRKVCGTCKRGTATKLCDFPLKGSKAGKTCDAPLCDSCAVSGGPDIDHCPPHARVIAYATPK